MISRRPALFHCPDGPGLAKQAHRAAQAERAPHCRGIGDDLAAARIQTAMIIGCALIEALTIYALVSIFILQGKITG